MPQYVDEVFVNGKQIGAFGQLEGHRFVYVARPVLISIPPGAIPPGAPISIAVRFSASSFWRSQALTRNMEDYVAFRYSVPLRC